MKQSRSQWNQSFVGELSAALNAHGSVYSPLELFRSVFGAEPHGRGLVTALLRDAAAVDELHAGLEWGAPAPVVDGPEHEPREGAGSAVAEEVLVAVDRRLRDGGPVLQLLAWEVLLDELIPRIVEVAAQNAERKSDGSPRTSGVSVGTPGESPLEGFLTVDRARLNAVIGTRLRRATEPVPLPFDKVRRQIVSERFTPTGLALVENAIAHAILRQSDKLEFEDVWRGLFDGAAGLRLHVQAVVEGQQPNPAERPAVELGWSDEALGWLEQAARCALVVEAPLIDSSHSVWGLLAPLNVVQRLAIGVCAGGLDTAAYVNELARAIRNARYADGGPTAAPPMQPIGAGQPVAAQSTASPPMDAQVGGEQSNGKHSTTAQSTSRQSATAQSTSTRSTTTQPTATQPSTPQPMRFGPLPFADLTFLAAQGHLEPAVIPTDPATGLPGAWEGGFERLARGLYQRQTRLALLVGSRGIGLTTFVLELARRAAGGEIPFLRERRFLWIDGRNAEPGKSRQILESVFAQFGSHPENIVCLDGLAGLLRGEGGTHNGALFRSCLGQARAKFIGVVSPWEFDELLAGDMELLQECARIDMAEPDAATALAIVTRRARDFERQSNVRIAPEAVERGVTLTAKYVWSESLPVKALRVLQRACEQVEFSRTQLGEDGDRVEARDVIRVLSEATRIPEETLSGALDDTDFEELLASAVVGQPDAVGQVAAELRLIKSGMTDPRKPASVMLFCGLNGVGKTELAKRLAEVYSATKRLQVYTMANYIESHSVSGIIGVPAGYVGHDQGGRLINDLNADPYGVFLLDEIEKAHPDVLKPFLNLFDEGWIADQRGIKAYADRAIFILTSNAGYEAIAQMHQDRRPMGEIAEHVKNTLAQVRNERSSQPVLSTAFLSRIKRIVVFNPLDEPALRGIARILIGQVQSRWKELREKTIVVPEELVCQIAKRGRELNERSNGREGGRGIRRLIDDLVEDRIQRAATGARQEYTRCRTIELGCDAESELEGEVNGEGVGAGADSSPGITVTFR
ncbi:MAG: AAA family ATPase [Planctomycetales bacterium]